MGPVVVTSALGLVSVPVVIAAVGAEIWGRVAVAQALGMFIGTIVSFGWPVVGAALVASSGEGERSRLYWASILCRIITFAPSASVVVVLVALPIYGARDIAAELIAALTPLIAALGFSWFFVGEASVRRYNTFDVLPRVLGTIAGIIGIVLTGSLLLFLGAQLVGQLAAVFSSAISIRKRYARGSRLEFKKTVSSGFSLGAPGVSNALLSSLYQNAPLVIIGVVSSPYQTAIYAMADRFLKLGALVIVPVSQTAQSWVPAAIGSTQLRRRISLALFASAAVGFAGWGTSTVLIPVGSTILSGGEVVVPTGLAALLGVALLALLMNAVVGRACLVPLGERRGLVVAPIVALAVGVPTQWLMGSAWGAVGVGAGLAIAESVAAATLISFLIVAMRRARHETAANLDDREAGDGEGKS